MQYRASKTTATLTVMERDIECELAKTKILLQGLPFPIATRIDHVVEGEGIASVDDESAKSETGMGFWRSLTSALLAASLSS